MQEAFYKSFDNLNEYQQAAVLDHGKVLLVNAHVGSGKTTVLTHKVLYLHFVKGIPLQSMVVLTFTNKAAEEIKDRIKLLDPSIIDDELNFFGTFHSVARTLLAKVLPIEDIGFTPKFSISDNDELLEIYERVINENKLDLKYKNKIKKRIERYRQGQSFLYGNMKHDDDLKEFLLLLKQEKRKCNVMDFDDLIDYVIQLLPASDFSPEWVIIDEFQDCDAKQLEIIELMSKGKANVFAVGDPNQVIYSWRGGSGNIFESFKNKHRAAELTLPVNYRSTATILNAARAFLETGNRLEGVRESGNPIIIKKHHNTFNEALYLCDRIKKLVEEGFSYCDIAVFYRKQKNAEGFKEVFEKYSIPCEISIKKTLKDIPVLYWLVRLIKASVNVDDKSSIAYILRDNRYGLAFSNKKASSAIKEFYEKDSSDIQLLNKIKSFETWCSRNISDEHVKAEDIYNYFDLGGFLMPTSISFQEDHDNVMKLLNELADYVSFKKTGIISGVRDYIDKSSLYGSQIVNETIHKDNNSVKLMTLHASKGLEFKHVFISGANLGNIPLANRSMEEEQEEQRLFFVGITRAKDSLEISYHVKPEDFGVYGVPSPYLRMIPEELIKSEDFGSRASSLSALRKEIRSNMEGKAEQQDEKGNDELIKEIAVSHAKYGKGKVVGEDEENITVIFEIYGEKIFTKAFCPLKFD